MIQTKLKGMGVALITPFKEDESVDYDALMRMVDYLLQNNADFLCVLGTTAETPTLTEEEKKTIKSPAQAFFLICCQAMLFNEALIKCPVPIAHHTTNNFFRKKSHRHGKDKSGCCHEKIVDCRINRYGKSHFIDNTFRYPRKQRIRPS